MRAKNVIKDILGLFFELISISIYSAFLFLITWLLMR